MRMNEKRETENYGNFSYTVNIVNILSNYMFWLFEISRSWKKFQVC